ncbi:MAG: hypothetical protein RBT71_00385 [Flavobacteriales bacterium]|jgi:hypothetical protein|nr:hypothetical protein [Flavobacteriales bacterium]
MNKHLILLAVACMACGTAPDPQRQGRPAPVDPAPDGPFATLPMRFDGYYMAENDGVMYMVRFFPGGNAVLINGLGEGPGDLPAKLVPDAVPDPLVGHYNVPVEVHGDSLFFTTTPRRGEIHYRGAFIDAQTLRLHRRSDITGRQDVLEYRLRPDPSQ